MGLFDLFKRVRGTGSAPSTDTGTYGEAGARTPDLDVLVTDAEIAAVTGSHPVGEPRRNGADGSETDLGRLVIRRCELADGGAFLISLGNCANPAAASRAMDRIAETEKPLSGVGERGLVDVERSATKGTSEISVTALHRNFTLSLVHTSTDARTDPAPLVELLRIALTRL
jgi:hypothetical protein